MKHVRPWYIGKKGYKMKSKEGKSESQRDEWEKKFKLSNKCFNKYFNKFIKLNFKEPLSGHSIGITHGLLSLVGECNVERNKYELLMKGYDVGVKEEREKLRKELWEELWKKLLNFHVFQTDETNIRLIEYHIASVLKEVFGVEEKEVKK